MTVEIRRANPADLETVLALVEEYCGADFHDYDEAVARRGVQPLLADDRYGVIVLAVVDGEVDGYAAVTWGWSIEVGGLDVVLDELYVRFRGRGTGSLLITAVESECRDRGVRRIFLETEVANVGARRLYEQHGFVADTSVWMAKQL